MRLLASKKGKSVCLDSPLQVVITVEVYNNFICNIIRWSLYVHAACP